MNDPFKIDGPACISISGGRTSGYLWRKVLEAHDFNLPPDVVGVFANTGKEEEATLQFVRDMETHWGVPIAWVEFKAHEEPAERWHVVSFDTASRNGEPFEQLIRQKQYLPNPVTRFCTIEMKIRTIARYLRSVGFEGTMSELENSSVIGIRADEPRRVAKIKDRSRLPLVAAGVGAADVGAFWRAQPFDLQLPNIGGRTMHGNCDLCFLKPGAQVLSLISEKPQRAVWWARMEALALALASMPSGAVFRSDRPSYAQMIAFASEQHDMFDNNEEAIACFCGD
jgi:hypothetical protein